MSKYIRLTFVVALTLLTVYLGSDSRRTSYLSPGTDIRVRSTTTGTVSVKLSDIPVGKVTQVGELKFVKVGEDQYLSISPGCVDPVLTTTGAQKLLSYTGNYQSYTFQAGCEYQIELWGASGGTGGYPRTYSQPGKGAYVSGNIIIDSSRNLYIYIGGQGGNNYNGSKADASGGWNGGGPGGYDNSNYNAPGGGGGGATDIRTAAGTWNTLSVLTTRIMVAAGGGGGGALEYTDQTEYCGLGVAGHGISNTEQVKRYAGNWNANVTQTSGYAFGYGYNVAKRAGEGFAGGGGGWWGGNQISADNGGPAAGGVSYISGHTGCVATANTSSSAAKSGCLSGTTTNSCSISATGLSFTNTVMIDGNGFSYTNTKGALQLMPNPTGGNYASGVGHTGNGYARITRLN